MPSTSEFKDRTHAGKLLAKALPDWGLFLLIAGEK